jgi:hypothetical protein
MANTIRTITEKDLEKHLTKLQRAMEETKQLQADLRATAQFALGTGDVDVSKVDLITKVEALLKTGAMSLAELSVELGVPTGPVSKALGALRRKGQVWNAGEEDRPRWRWVIGDDCSFPELVDEVRRLLTERPMTHADLKAATAANPNRLKGAVTQLQRNGVTVVNVSDDPRRALWYVRPA